MQFNDKLKIAEKKALEKHEGMDHVNRGRIDVAIRHAKITQEKERQRAHAMIYPKVKKFVEESHSLDFLAKGQHQK